MSIKGTEAVSELVKIDISIKEGVYIATSEDLLGLFVADRNIIDLFNEIPGVIEAIHKEEQK